MAPTGYGAVSAAASTSAVGSSAAANNPAGWKRVEMPTQTRGFFFSPTEAASTGFGLWTIRRTAFAALCLAFVLIVASLLWITLGDSIHKWWLLIAASTVALILVPLWLLPLIQLLSLSLLMAAFLRLGCVVCRLRDNGSSNRGRSSVVSGLIARWALVRFMDV